MKFAFTIASLLLASAVSASASGDGQLVGWGSNLNGVVSVTPASLIPFADLASGQEHTVALRSDGTLACWGRNNNGQCSLPTDLGYVRAIDAGLDHTIALRLDGTVRCWGGNNFGQCTVPAGLDSVAALSTQENHNVALRTNGAVVCWGDNGSGQCSVPANLGTAVRVGAGRDHSVALQADGAVRCWGGDAFGQCTVPGNIGIVVDVDAGGLFNAAIRSDGSLRCWGYPFVQPPAGLGAVSRVSCGAVHAIALLTDGTVRCFGESNAQGQLTTPSGLSGVTRITAGGFHTGVLRADGSIQMWGDGSKGQTSVPIGLEPLSRIAIGLFSGVGIRADGTLRTWGAELTGLTGVAGTFVDASVGVSHALALTTKGSVRSGGLNFYGESVVPPALGSCTEISAGGYHSMARTQSGQIVCWGAGLTDLNAFPHFGQSIVPVDLGSVAAIDAGRMNSLALLADGSVRGWGQNNLGQSSPPPTLADAIAISAGNEFALALRADGTVVNWGLNGLNPPSGLAGVVAIEAGETHALALLASGTVRAWGSNGSSESSVPVNLQGVTSLAAGATVSAVLLDQTISSCGNPGGAGSVTLKTSGSGWHDVGTWAWSGNGGPQVPGGQTDVDLGNYGSVGSDCGARAGTLTARAGSTLIIRADLASTPMPDHAIDVTGTAALAGRIWLVATGASSLPADLDIPVLTSSNPQGFFDIIETTVPPPPGKFLTLVPTFGGVGGVMYRLQLRDIAGSSSLVSSASASFTGSAVGAATMDLNLDGFDDLALAIDYGPGFNGVVQVLLNDGLGGLGSVSVLASTPPQPTSIATGDADGDGRDDVAVGIASDSTGRLFLGAGRGNGALLPSTVYLVNGTPTAIAIIPGGAPLMGGTVGDVAIGSTGGTGAGAGNKVAFYPAFASAPSQTVPITHAANAVALRGRIVGAGGTTASNVDRMKRASLVNENGAISVLTPSAGGTYSVTQTVPVPGKPVGLAFADIDGDGFAEIVTANLAPVPQGGATALPVLTLFRGGATGLGSAVPLAPEGGTAGLDVALLDADLDGDLDVVAVYQTVTPQSRASLLRIDTAGPGGPLTIGSQTDLTAVSPVLCAPGNLDGVGGQDFYLVDSAGTASFRGGSAAGTARPFLSLVPDSTCPADLTGNNFVDGDDLSVLLASWGLAGAGDISHNGSIGSEDLAMLIAAWGACGNGFR